MPENNRKKGADFEDRAASFLQAKQYRILERNYLRKTGEIDLIAKSPEGVLVFTEVKYRGSRRAGAPMEAVTLYKQKRIFRTAEWYIREKKIPADTKMRFDVISIYRDEITHIMNVFGGF